MSPRNVRNYLIDLIELTMLIQDEGDRIVHINLDHGKGILVIMISHPMDRKMFYDNLAYESTIYYGDEAAVELLEDAYKKTKIELYRIFDESKNEEL